MRMQRLHLGSTPTRQIQMMPVPTLLQHASTKGGCLLFSGTLTCTDTSPILIVSGNFVGGAFRMPLGISSSTHFTFSFAVSTPLLSIVPAHHPIFHRLFPQRASQRWHTRFARFF